MTEVVGLLKLSEQEREFVDVVGRRHLAEIISGCEGAAKEMPQLVGEAEFENVAAGAGAANRNNHGIDLRRGETDGRQVTGGKSAAADDVDESVFCAGALAVGPELKVAGVVQEH